MEFLSGNEAIARGAWEAGCHIGTAYPGTPSTETMETFATLPGVYAEWCPNEKVALEVAMGASAAGARVLVTMKHVGVNVCADPLFTASYTGVNGGVLLLAADDPGMFSSQNEQDSRYYAMASLVPILEPADSQEALDFARSAYDLSEQFDVPFMMRSTVRISHTKTPVEVGERTEVEKKPYESDPTKWVMMPAFAKPRRKVVVKRTETLKEWVETCPFNRVEKGDTSIGIICAGAVYEHVKEALGDVSIFKLGVTWPLPADALARFAESVDKVYVVEEASTYLSDAVRSCGIALDEFVNPLPADGEVHPEDILHAFGKETPAHLDTPGDVPNRPPALCAGCPHRIVFRELARNKAIVTGDIGCYTLGALPPLSAMDTTLDMGASVSMAHGFELAMAGSDHRGHRIAKTHDRGNRATTLCHAMDLRNLAALPCRTRNTREQRGCGDRSLTTNAAKQNGECLIAHIALPSTDARSHRTRSTERTASIHCTYRYRSTKSPFRDRLKLRGIPT